MAPPVPPSPVSPLPGDPTPQQRADFLVRKLESFIREGKTATQGMSFKTWQGMARAELANAFADLERQLARGRRDTTARRLILVGVATVVTIGFWGTVVVLDRHFGMLAAWIATGAGALLAAVLAEVAIRWGGRRYHAAARAKSFDNVVAFDKQLRRFEAELKKKVKAAEAELAEVD